MMIIIAVGSNLSGKWGTNSYDTCQKAIRCFTEVIGCDKITVSQWYQTTPIPSSSQPLYVNGAFAFQKKMSCNELLSVLQGIEAEAGRIRHRVNEARPLDLDIIAFNDEIIYDPPGLVVPHPRTHLRAFVLYPLRDILPGWIHPQFGKSVNQLIDELPEGQGIELYEC